MVHRWVSPGGKEVGVLALQGAFDKHLKVCQKLGYPSFLFREPADLPRLGALIIPGGESTTIGMLLERRDLLSALRNAISEGLPVFGTCAGAILLAKEIKDSSQARLGNLDVEIERNAYGSQVDSFEAHLDVTLPLAKEGFEAEAVFIRAPRFSRLGPSIETLGSFGGAPVLIQSNKILACAFHPELTNDFRIHRYFLHDIAQLRPD